MCWAESACVCECICAVRILVDAEAKSCAGTVYNLFYFHFEAYCDDVTFRPHFYTYTFLFFTIFHTNIFSHACF